MTKSTHKIETDWRAADAAAWDERVRVLNEWLEHTEDMIDMLENEKEIVTSARSLCGLIKAERDGNMKDAEALRTASVK